MKKSFITFLVSAFLLTALLPFPAEAVLFPDIKGHWAESYINDLAGAGSIKGYPEGTFKPDNPMTRAEFTTLLISVMGINPQVAGENGFIDIGKHWGKNYINEAVRQNILIPTEYPQGLVPDGNIKRSEAAAMLVRALGEKPDTGNLPPFTDLADVEKSVYKAFIKKAFDLKLLSGFPGGEFQPFTDMTRGQVAKVITDFLSMYNGGTLYQTAPIVSGNITELAIGDEKYSLNQTPVTFKFAYSSVPLTSISVAGDQVTINGAYNFFLNTPIGNPDLLVNGKSYIIGKYTISGKILVAFPQSQSIDSLQIGGYKYNTDFVQLFINSASSNYYLGDIRVIDEYNVTVAGKTYNLKNDRLTVNLGGDFYDIDKINMSNADNPLVLAKSSRVLLERLHVSDISAIIVDDRTLSLKNIGDIEFLLGDKIYGLGDVSIDASGNFLIGYDTYPFEKVQMYVDRQRFAIEDINIYREKFIFYCTESEENDMVIVNGKYLDAEDIRIIKGTSFYDLDEVLVISRNLVRIGSKQYDIDSTFKVRIDKITYDIDRIDYNVKMEAVEMMLTESKDAVIGSQPDRIIFYVDDRKYQDGVKSSTEIYINREWISFNKVTIVDPATFSYKGRSYDLIDADISLAGDDYTVVDTSWTGQRQIFSIYLE